MEVEGGGWRVEGGGWGLGAGVGLEGWRWASALVERKAWQSSGRMTLVLPEPT